MAEYRGKFSNSLISLSIIILSLGAALNVNAATIVVPAGGNLQAALNVAQSGDTIILAADATFVGPFSLPNKSGSGYITIQSARASEIVGRVTPGQRTLLARLQSGTNAEQVIRTAPGAHHYKLIGLDISTTTNSIVVYDLVRLGGSEGQTTLSDVPHDLIIDRCYIHGLPTQEVQRGVSLNSSETSIINSYISDIHGLGYDTQAIAGWNGPGPFHIINNYLEAGGENMLFGGSDPSIPNLVPSDIEIRQNHIFKPLSWKIGDPSFAGMHWTVKNLLELKNARNVVIDGNVFENCWTDGQTGIAILFTVRNQGGTAPWSIVQNVTFSNNIVKGAEGAINMLGSDNERPSQRSTGAVIANNLFTNIRGTFLTLNGYYDVKVSHNTSFQTNNTYTLYGEPSAGFVSENNLTIENPWGIYGDGGLLGTQGLNHWTPGFVFSKNLMVGAASNENPTGNFYPAQVADVGFIGFQTGNYALSVTSPYHNAGTDGKDVGVDFVQLNAALAGATPTPTPTPTPTVSPTPLPSPTPTPNPTPTPTPSPSPTPSPTPTPTPVLGPAIGSRVTLDIDGVFIRSGLSITYPVIGTQGTSARGTVDQLCVNDPVSPRIFCHVTFDAGVSGGLTVEHLLPLSPSSPASVGRAKDRGNNLLGGLTSSSGSTYAGAADTSMPALAVVAELESLATDIAIARGAFTFERSLFVVSADAIDSQLQAALAFTKADAALASRLGPTNSVRNHLLRVVAHLAIAEDLMLYGSITSATANQALIANARIDVTIGPANTGYGTNAAGSLAPRSLSSVFGNATLSPLSSQTLFASPASDGTFPYELAGVNVTVGGKAVPVIYVSPTRISFHVAPDVQLGAAEVIVTTDTGYVSLGSTNIARNVFRLITASDNGSGEAVAQNVNNRNETEFEVTSPDNFGPDKRTRLMIFATGLSGSAINSNFTNDVTRNGVMQPNFAESVTVEARRTDGSVIVLPVEFAGAQGFLPGLDQVNVMLTPQLAGAGSVELTLIIGGLRSNAPTIFVR